MQRSQFFDQAKAKKCRVGADYRSVSGERGRIEQLAQDLKKPQEVDAK